MMPPPGESTARREITAYRTGSRQSLHGSRGNDAHSSGVSTSESARRHGLLRYGDGTDWTEHITPDPAAAGPTDVLTPSPQRPYTSGTAWLGVAALFALGAIAL